MDETGCRFKSVLKSSWAKYQVREIALVEQVAIVGGTVIDGNGGVPTKSGTVLIEGNRIISVGDQALPIPTDASRIDAAGKYIIPGLMDANVHLVQDTKPLSIVRYEGRYDEVAIEAAQVALKSGVTTVFDSWGPRQYLIKARDAIASGRSHGARIYCAGNIVGLGGPYSEDFLPAARSVLYENFSDRINALWQENVGPELVWMSPDQVRREIRAYARRGIDFLKFAVTTHRPSSAHIMFSPRVQRVIVEEAHAAGLTAQTHTTTNEGLHLAIEAGVDLMQHVDLTHGPERIPEETLELIVDSRIACALLAQTDRALAAFREFGRSSSFFRLYDSTIDPNTRMLIHSGAVIVLSTDAGVFCENTLTSESYRRAIAPEESLLILGEGHFHWLLAAEQKGMRPMDMLMAATKNIARAYKVDSDLGTIEAGKIADIVVLDRDPLASAMNYRSIDIIIKDGRVVDRHSLPTRRLLTERDLNGFSQNFDKAPAHRGTV
jgi:imidazolonepropionase-like amidohydrolase